MAKKTSEKLAKRLETGVQTNQSKVSLVLGILIVIAVGILIFNYFSKSRPSLGPAQQTQIGQQDTPGDQLTEKYTVKEGDTLFEIAEKYYKSGDGYRDIAKINNIVDPDQITSGQVLQIPKLESQQPQLLTQASPSTQPEGQTTKDDAAAWGPKIGGNTYTVVEGDWLSKIAGRAYGDIFAFDKIAKANNISDPNHIEPGTVLTIPR